MTSPINIEMNDKFDLLYNNSFSNNAPNLNLYEKSLYLTKAQSELISSKLIGLGTKYGAGAEDMDKRMRDIEPLITTVILEKWGGYTSAFSTVDEYDTWATLTNADSGEYLLFDYDSISDKIMILNEELVLSKKIVDEKGNETTYTRSRQVLVLSFNEYERMMSKPYHYPLKRQCWRIETGTRIKEIILNKDDAMFYEPSIRAMQGRRSELRIRYVKKPSDIILFGNSTSLIDSSDDFDYTNVVLPNVSHEQPCIFNSQMREEIVQRAVEIAKAIYNTDSNTNVSQLQNTISIGQRSE